MITLKYEDGSIRIFGGDISLNGSEIRKSYPAYLYPKIIRYLENSNIDYSDEVKSEQKLRRITSEIKLRDYQKEALEHWKDSDNRGIIVLPTGAGKTVVALKAIEDLNVPTLIVVPTLVLLDQWRERIKDTLGIYAGKIGGGSLDITPITVSTYASASLRAYQLGDKFQLIIFDEVHHLPAPSYRKIGLNYFTPYRMGLTATLQSDDASRSLLREIVGEVVYHLKVDSLAGIHLANYRIKTVKIPLSPAEKTEYNKQYGIYRSYLSKHRIRFRSTRDYLNFVKKSGRNPEARRALLARNRAMNIALNSSSKIDYLKALLKDNFDEKTLIFTRHNKLVYRISKELLIPAITHQTSRQERVGILHQFRKGVYPRIVTSQVLDEGVDVPDASMAIILSGTGSNREFIQRLGRILRKKDGKQAVLYELVSADTVEVRISRRRRKD